MSIGNYGELKTAVASWLDRSDLTSLIPDFVALAEAELRTDVRCQAMEQTASGTLSGSTLAHPTRYLEARRLTVGGKVYRYVSPEVYAAAVDNSSTQRIFTAIGQEFSILGASSGDAYTLVYYQAFAALSADGDTNWLLTNHPGVYLYAACLQGAQFLQDPVIEQRFTALYQSAVGRLVSREKASAVSGSALIIRAAVTE